MTPKKYKLLQDINSPDLKAKAGEIGVSGRLVGDDTKVWFDNKRYYFWLTTVLGSPDFFEEVKEPERIEASIDGFDITAPVYRNDLYTSHPIPAEKFPAIKKAIEQVLNGEYDGPCLYTQSEYDKAIEDAFEAARSGCVIPTSNGQLQWAWRHTYAVFQHYQATLKK